MKVLHHLHPPDGMCSGQLRPTVIALMFCLVGLALVATVGLSSSSARAAGGQAANPTATPTASAATMPSEAAAALRKVVRSAPIKVLGTSLARRWTNQLAYAEPAAPDASPAAAKPKATLVLVNDSDREVCYVYIVSAGSDEWGSDWLADVGTIQPGGEYSFKLRVGDYDLRADDCEGSTLDEQYGFRVKGRVEWTIVGPEPEEEEVEGEDREQVRPADELEPTELPDVQLTEFLCCGLSAGGTFIWGINYPSGWRVELGPNDPNGFVAASFYDPDSTVEIHLWPSAFVPQSLNYGDVDQFLDALGRQRAREAPGWDEFLREVDPNLPNARVWAGTWETNGEQMWESAWVMVTAMPYVDETLPRGALALYDLRGSSSDWRLAKHIFDQMMHTLQMQRTGQGGYTPPVRPGRSDDPEEQQLAEASSAAPSFWELVFCPRACHWEYIDVANQPAGSVWCCSDGCVGQLSEVPCLESECTASCAR